MNKAYLNLMSLILKKDYQEIKKPNKLMEKLMFCKKSLNQKVTILNYYNI